MEWNELPQNIRADYIRQGVSLGYRSLEDIQQNFNSFNKGGKKNKPNYKASFLKQLDQALSKHQEFNTPQWRKYFTNLAYRESRFKNVTNGIGASGYFQLMPYNRKTGNQFEDMFSMTKNNIKWLQKHLTKDDYLRMQKQGIDITGLLGGMHLGGAGAIKKWRQGKASYDMNGTSTNSYIKEFSQGADYRVPDNIFDQSTPNVPLAYTTKQQAIQKASQIIQPQQKITYLNQDDNTDNTNTEPVVQEQSIDNSFLYNMPSFEQPIYQIQPQEDTTQSSKSVTQQILDEPFTLLNDNDDYNTYINTSALGGRLFKKGGPQKTNAGIQEAKEQYPALNNLDIDSYADPDYNVGYGSIEYFPKGTKQIVYGDQDNPTIVLSPNPKKNTILYNPNAYTNQNELNEAIALDMVSHGMHQDTTYDTENALLGSFYPDDAIANAVLGYEKEHGIKASKQSIVSRFKRYQTNPTFMQEYYTPAVDGIVRGYLFEKNHPDKNDAVYNRQNYYNKAIEELSPEQRGVTDQIYQYLTTGQQPQNMLPEIVITGNKHAEGGLQDINNSGIIEYDQLPQNTQDIIDAQVYPRFDIWRRTQAQDVPQYWTLVSQDNQDSPLGYDALGSYVQGTNPDGTSNDEVYARQGWEDTVLPHEQRHRIDNYVPLTDQEIEILNNAYFTTPESQDIIINGEHYNPKEEGESVTTNLDSRIRLLNALSDQNNDYTTSDLDTQNNLIKNASDDQIFESVWNSGDYGMNFINSWENSSISQGNKVYKDTLNKLKASGDKDAYNKAEQARFEFINNLRHQQADNIRKAMMEIALNNNTNVDNYAAYGGRILAQGGDDNNITQAYDQFKDSPVGQVASFIPILGTAMDGIELIRHPSLENAAWFGVGLASDIFGGRAVTGLAKAAKGATHGAKLVRTAKGWKTIDAATNAQRSYDAVRSLALPLSEADNYTQWLLEQRAKRLANQQDTNNAINNLGNKETLQPSLSSSNDLDTKDWPTDAVILEPLKRVSVKQ